MAESSPFEIQKGIEVYGSEQKFNQILLSYSKELNISLNELNEAFKDKDQDKVRKAAHKLKGSSSYVAATKLQKLCFALQLLNEPENQFQYELCLRIYQDVAKESDLASQYISQKFSQSQDPAFSEAVKTAISLANETVLPDSCNIEEILQKYKK